MKLGNILDEIVTDYEIDIQKYDKSNDKFSYYEDVLQTDYKDYLDRTYVATISGSVLYNIDIPNYYSPKEELLSVLLIFNDDSELVGSAIFDENSSFETSALLYMKGGY